LLDEVRGRRAEDTFRASQNSTLIEAGSCDVAGKAVERLRRRIERDYDAWLTQEFRIDPAGLADARAAIASFDFVLPRCLPDAAAVVAAQYDPQAIAALVVGRAWSR
jgi:hypothetical protein